MCLTVYRRGGRDGVRRLRLGHDDLKESRAAAGEFARGCSLLHERRPSDSFATPLKGALLEVFTAMMRPVEASRLALWPLDVLNCVRPVTEPTRLPLPVFFAIGFVLLE